MLDSHTLLVIIVISALAFDYINGFHDTANAIATVVSTRVMKPRTAILMAAGLNLVGAMIATSVAKTIAKGIVDPAMATETVILAAVLAGILWNLITWRFGIPSSSSHTLIGGLIGAGIMHGGKDVVLWGDILKKVLIPLVASPLVGFGVGFVLMTAIAVLFASKNPRKAGAGFKKAQIFSAAAMAFSHGNNDAQKSMGIITLALVSNKMIPNTEVPMWVKIACAVAMAAGTSVGGWRIIKTMGHRIIRLEPVNGFAAETAGAAVILGASHMGMPVSTTHVIAGSIFGVGASKRISAVRWQVALNMVSAWVLTIPASAIFGMIIYAILRALHA